MNYPVEGYRPSRSNACLARTPTPGTGGLPQIFPESGNSAVAQWRPPAPIESALVVQDHAEKTAVHRQPMAVVIDKAKPLELVHEMTDP